MKSGWVKLRGGAKAIPIRVEHLLQFPDLVRVLCSVYRDWQAGDDPLPDLNRGHVRKTIRLQLQRRGWEDGVFWSDEVAEADFTVINAWAEKLIERTYGRA